MIKLNNKIKLEYLKIIIAQNKNKKIKNIHKINLHLKINQIFNLQIDLPI